MAEPDAPTTLIENRTLEELRIGDSAQMVRVLARSDIELFAIMSGDVTPAHLDAKNADDAQVHHVIAHGMWGGALISAVLGTRLPGPGTIYIDQALHFHIPVAIGDTITVRVTVAHINKDTGHVLLDCSCHNQHGKLVIDGQAKVLAPRQKLRRAATALPTVRMHNPGARFAALVDRARTLPPLPTAVVHPCDASLAPCRPRRQD